MPEQRLVNKLLNTSGVTDLVGTRIRAVRPLQGDTYPVLVYQRVGTDPCNTASGASDVAWARIQITALAETYPAAKALAAAVKAALGPTDADGWTDDTGTPVVSSTHWLGDYDLPFEAEPGQDAGIHAVAADYRIQYA